MRRFEERNQPYLDLQLRLSSQRAFAMPVLGLSGLVGTGLVLWIGGDRVIAGLMPVGAIATFTTLLGSLVALLMALAWVLASISRGLIAISRIDEVIATPDDLPIPSASLDLRRPAHARAPPPLLHLPRRRPPLPPRHRCVPPARSDPRHLRPHRRRQEHPHQPALPRLHPPRRLHPRRRQGHHLRAPRRPPRRPRRRPPGPLPLLHHPARQHPPARRTQRPHPRRGRRSRPAQTNGPEP
jgi:ABC-type multidrug transport system fused ATPase/permease subunit